MVQSLLDGGGRRHGQGRAGELEYRSLRLGQQGIAHVDHARDAGILRKDQHAHDVLAHNEVLEVFHGGVGRQGHYLRAMLASHGTNGGVFQLDDIRNLVSRLIVQRTGLAGVLDQGAQGFGVVAGRTGAVDGLFASQGHHFVGHDVDPLQQRAEDPHEATCGDRDELQGGLRVGNRPGLRCHLTQHEVEEGNYEECEEEANDVGNAQRQARGLQRCHEQVVHPGLGHSA